MFCLNNLMLFLYSTRLALTLIQKIEVKLRLGNKNEQAHFVFHSTCINFA